MYCTKNIQESEESKAKEEGKVKKIILFFVAAKLLIDCDGVATMRQRETLLQQLLFCCLIIIFRFCLSRTTTKETHLLASTPTRGQFHQCFYVKPLHAKIQKAQKAA